ncbi:LamG domain-containing protein [Pleionea sp. CnH1-48]|uniref:LamG domain-containing protein n=1 Tax=Pleionea sp. CnH1-48 TaxID=2954494 RepID=UPI0020983EFC|nr:LamG domain-containing protein [Pleionea sp. CnH1-48]MCO7225552.1 LamG domain-containing protein [Pleionea sp. CnH1-48]
MTKNQSKLSLSALIKNSAAIMVSTLVLTACTGGGPATETTPPSSGSSPDTYSGPPPASDDVQRFKLFVWDNLATNNRCGACHNETGQSPQFARGDDVNLAYAAANTIVDLANPDQSRMVTKVAEGHNCWESVAQVCADTITSYINNWAGNSASSTTEITLTAPPIRDPGASRAFPDDPSNFQSTVYPLLTQYCSDCHTDSASVPISPYFASADVNTAYEAAKSKIDLDTPASSRFVIRLRNEFHNCWTTDCASNANEMQTAIENFASTIPLTQIDSSLVASKALTLLDGIQASSGGRFEANAIATFQFKTGNGVTAFDTSGVEPAMNLTFNGDVEWVGGWGINIRDGKAQASTSSSKKLYDLITATNEYSIEAWVAPNNVTQEGPARIVNYSGGADSRNFMLGQTLYNYDFLNRSTNADANGNPSLSTADADERLQATLQHVIVTYDPVNGRRIYVNGQYTGDADGVEPGTLNDWNDTFAFVLGSEVSGEFKWSGVVRFVSIHNRALTEEQIQQNYDAGVGERFFLLFSVGHLVDVPDSYIVFEVSQFDSYGYLFAEPFFISLDETATPNNIPVQGMRIGINGAEAAIGQSFEKLNMALDDAQYNSGSGQVISPLGAVIALEKGPTTDEFFLTFERLGTHENVRVDAQPQPAPTPPDLDEQSDLGVRTFEEIYATMAQMTGVSMNEAGVRGVYLTVKQQLPTNDALEGFLSSNQMGVTQLAIQYCSALMDDTSLRASKFPAFNFTADPATSFTAQGRNDFLDPLLEATMGIGLASQPQANTVKGELNNLIDQLTTCTSNGSCEAGRTIKVTKATCAAAIGSAIMLVQ